VASFCVHCSFSRSKVYTLGLQLEESQMQWEIAPGSMGWPLVGETLQFFAPSTSFDINPFVKKRMERYGPIFRTNLVGRPVIVSTDSDLNHFVFQQEGQLFQSWYPDTFTEIFGRQNVGSMHGFMYKYLKSLVLNLFGPESLKKMLPEVEQAANRNLKMWSRQDTVELKDATASGRKKAMRMLKTMLDERRARPQKLQRDFFDYVLEELEREDTILTKEIALDLMFVLLFASFETTSLVITLATKLLVDNPLVLKALTEEHEAILKERKNLESGFTWKEYKSMKFTFQFINETVRLANIVPGIFRKAQRDIKFKDYTIPAGWAVMVCPPAVHLNPARYENPLDFNPWRWEVSRAYNFLLY
ncbi:hypothetical protein RJ639_020495, partial [Escallonia herrerae]